MNRSANTRTLRPGGLEERGHGIEETRQGRGEKERGEEEERGEQVFPSPLYL